jgi:phosphatidylglycerophosphate synthase
MIDARLRRYLDPPLDALARRISRTPLTANHITVGGFVIGLLAIPLLAQHHYGLALAVIGVNRLADGLDGAVARHTGVTDIGGYLDIVLDFIFYAAVVFGFTLGHADQAVYGAFLIFSFFASGATFLAYAIFAARHGITTEIRGRLLPDKFWLVALVFGGMCWVTGLTRISWAWQTLGGGSPPR